MTPPQSKADQVRALRESNAAKSSDGAGESRPREKIASGLREASANSVAKLSAVQAQSPEQGRGVASGVRTDGTGGRKPEVASGPSEAKSARSSVGSEQPPSKRQVAGSNPAEQAKRGRPKIKGPRPWEEAGMSRRTWYRRQAEKAK